MSIFSKASAKLWLLLKLEEQEIFWKINLYQTVGIQDNNLDF
jgi:hypothetical protein